MDIINQLILEELQRSPRLHTPYMKACLDWENIVWYKRLFMIRSNFIRKRMAYHDSQMVKGTIKVPKFSGFTNDK